MFVEFYGRCPFWERFWILFRTPDIIRRLPMDLATTMGGPRLKTVLCRKYLSSAVNILVKQDQLFNFFDLEFIWKQKLLYNCDCCMLNLNENCRWEKVMFKKKIMKNTSPKNSLNSLVLQLSIVDICWSYAIFNHYHVLTNTNNLIIEIWDI